MLDLRWPMLLMLSLQGGGCAKQPALETAATDSALRSAEVAGAEQLPEASLHLQLAREELLEAEALHEAGDPEEASSMLTRAAADAELALLLSHEQAQKDQANEALAKVAALRDAQ